MNAYSNTAFIPQPSAITPGQAAVAQLNNKNPDTEIFSTGVYNWANSDRDPQCSDEASRIFGSNLIDPKDSDYAALMIGNAVLTRSGCSDNPEAYFRAQGWTVPTGYGDYTNLTRIAGQRIMQQARALYDQNKKALAEAQAANKEQQARKDKCISIEKEAPAIAPKQPREDMMVYIGLALVGLLVAGWVLYVVAVVLLIIKDWLVQRVRGTCGTMRAGVPVIWQRMSSPEGMRGAFLVLVAALVVIALCLVAIACVLVF